ncbi:MAG TPA: DUF6036 family nucleotidyltransferase [Blastocatellia bacterium]|nr:DUF6036 family nucleotidyltransferase [Blastocatellia bacterium]
MNQDFKDLLAVFNAEKVKYLVIGGYAVIKHTEPRYTKDIDLWVSIGDDNPERVYRALKQFGAPLTNLSPKDFSQKGFFYTLGMAPRRVDILFDAKDLDFAECWERRVESDIGGVTIYFISASDLIINKEAVGRYQDLADVEKLRLAQERAIERKRQ